MKALRIAAPLLGLALLAAGCPNTAQVDCTSTADCDTGACHEGACVDRPIGAECLEPADCGPGGVCNLSLPAGYCTQTCADPGECPAGSTCFVSGGQGYCMSGCAGDADCRDGYRCSSGVCQNGCTEDAECLGGESCSGGRCLSSGAGDACNGDADCQGGLTCQGGVCTKACADASECPVGSTCVLEGDRSLCVAACRGDADCGESERCVLGGCIDRCTTDAWCGPDRVCNTETGLCRRAGGGSELTEIDLGQVSAGSELSFEVPAGTFSISLVVQGSASADYSFQSIKTPSGVELYNETGGAEMSEPLRVMPGNEIIVAQIPNGDDPVLTPTPGTWTFSYSGGTATAKVLLKTSPDGQSLGGTVDLNVFLAPGAFPNVTAANAASDATLQETLAYWKDTYEADAEIYLGEIRYYDLDDQFSDVTIDMFSGTGEHYDMWAQYGREDGLNVFFVRSIDSGFMSGVAGISGGIPGPPLIGGTSHSGIVIAVQDQPLLTGIDWCHEAGHFQGLYHTSEFNYFGGAQVHDNISDTPECSPPDGGCGEAKNHIMFPALDPQMHMFSPASAEILRGNAGVR